MHTCGSSVLQHPLHSLAILWSDIVIFVFSFGIVLWYWHCISYIYGGLGNILCRKTIRFLQRFQYLQSRRTSNIERLCSTWYGRMGEPHSHKRQMRLTMRRRGGAVENRPGHLLSAIHRSVQSLLLWTPDTLLEFTTIEACFLCGSQQKVFLLSH